MIHITKNKPGTLTMSKIKASDIVADELCTDWIMKYVYPLTVNAAATRILKTYDRFIYLMNKERASKLTKKLEQEAKELNRNMTNFAYDIRTHDVTYQKKLESEHNIKMTEEDEKFYKDNCYGSYTARCNDTVSKKWMKSEKRRLQRLESVDKKKRQMDTESALEDEQLYKLNSEDPSCEMDESYDLDKEFEPKTPVSVKPARRRRNTRSNASPSVCSPDDTDCDSYPDIPVSIDQQMLYMCRYFFIVIYH